MPIKLKCPKCKKILTIPSDRAGHSQACPNCNARFKIPDTIPSTGAKPQKVAEPPVPIEAAGPSKTPPHDVKATGPSKTPPHDIKAADPSKTPPHDVKATGSSKTPPHDVKATGSSKGMKAVPPSVATPKKVSSETGQSPSSQERSPKRGGKRDKKVARFITAPIAKSTLELAENGELPILHLNDGKSSEATTEKTKSTNPLLLFFALLLTIPLTAVALMVGVDEGKVVDNQKTAKARRIIRDDYFVNLDVEKPLDPYQKTLREAQRANSRRDFTTERRLYRQILKRLRAERKFPDKWLTGSRDRDDTLEKQICILLSED